MELNVPTETFQQPKIAGYRQLNVQEAALMNALKMQLGNTMQESLHEVSAYVTQQRADARRAGLHDEVTRIDAAQPERWIAIARTHFQEGLMALTRAVAQPGSF